MADERYDLAIVGSGGAAFAAAIQARRAHARVVMVERGQIGGTCVNVGCIPSKALLAAADARHVALDERFPGIRTSAEPVDMKALIGGKDEIVAELRTSKYVDLAQDYGWELLQGEARFDGDVQSPALDVDGRRIEAEHYIVATGAAPWAPPIEGLEDVGYLTSDTAMTLDHVPDSMIVVGGNYIGLEQGQLFARLGTKVTIVEALDRVAPNEEPEISQALHDVLVDEGIGVLTGANVQAVHREGGVVVVTAETQQGRRQLRAEQLLIATGRRPNTAGLNLDKVGVEVGRRGEIVVDDHLRSANPRVWAAGDVTGHPQFVYVAGAHGVIAAENALEGADRTVDYRTLPRVTFTTPSIASVGLTDEEANEAGLNCECRSVPLEYVPRALVNRDTRGLAKIVAERGSGRVVGIHLLAPNAGDVILAGVYALEAGMTVKQLANIWCPYLTMGEAVKLAAQAFVSDVTKLSCCAA
jgi:mercuric reductase